MFSSAGVVGFSKAAVEQCFLIAAILISEIWERSAPEFFYFDAESAMRSRGADCESGPIAEKIYELCIATGI